MTPQPTQRSSPMWDAATFEAAVGDAVWAPSIHNSQPWRFRRTAVGIDVLLDAGRVLPVCDPTGRAARVSCGAAAYNLGLAVAAAGAPALSAIGRGDVLVHLTPGARRPATPVERRLHRQIRRRHTNRTPFADSPVDPAALAQLVDAARRADAWLDIAADEPVLTTVATLIREADGELAANTDYVAELRAWTRSVDHRVEGIDPRAAGAAPHPAERLTRRDFGGPAHDATHDTARLPAAAVIGVHGDGPADEVRAGMALQHVLLTAADLGLAAAMYSQPIEVPAVRERLRVALRRVHLPQMVLRFGYAPTVCHTSRRPEGDVIDP